MEPRRLDEIEHDIKILKERMEMSERMRAYTPKQRIGDYQSMVELLQERFDHYDR